MFEIKGLDKAMRMLERLQHNAATLDGTHRVPMNKVFSPAFMRAHSRFPSFQAMLDASPFKDVEFEKIPDAEWDIYVRTNTSFSSWEAMKDKASTEWIDAKLMEGV
ncbi:MAG: hypothetical protein PHO20_00855 [Candidatus Peribacteraceae bacterium]|nr:hypothetical protein [Candidatus Peribacteraceae bacterium]MDD5739299.1 hypothetical protein [Candidatus Peribacteraceae bacterium]